MRTARMTDQKELEQRIAYLRSTLDALESELHGGRIVKVPASTPANQPAEPAGTPLPIAAG